MRTQVLIVAMLLAFIVGCNGTTFTAERLREVNDQWFKMYNADRRLTKVEAEEYQKLTDEQKDEWRKAGKPSDRPLSAQALDATGDFYAALNLEAEAAGAKKEE